uniref:Uncharacterized protein n=1 Tax=Arundo donax TaxID=35708 RepID=A0A0A8ZLS9_ARUDO
MIDKYIQFYLNYFILSNILDYFVSLLFVTREIIIFSYKPNRAWLQVRSDLRLSSSFCRARA